MGTLNLRSDRGQTILEPAGVTPSRRLVTLVEKRTHWNKSLMEGEGQARSQGIARPNRLCAHNHRYSKVAHLSHLAKQQRKPGEDRVLASTVTSQVKARSPATRSHDKPTEDVGKRRPGYNFKFLMYKTGIARMPRQGMEGKICRAPKARGL